MITITIEGIPISWLAHAGYGRRSFNPRYNEKAYTIYHIKQQFSQPPLTGPCSISYTFHMPIPKGTSKKKLAQMANGQTKHVKRPDCTNLTKFYEDCLKGIVLVDDSQVCESIARKAYSMHPKTVINIKTLN